MSDGKKMDQGTRNLLELKLFMDKISAVFFPDRPKILRSAVKLASVKMKMRAKALASGQRQAHSQRQGSQLNIKERFSNFKGLGFFQPQEPELTEEEQIVVEEKAKQVLEDAEKRKKDEEAKKKALEEKEDLKRAKERLSVHIGGN